MIRRQFFQAVVDSRSRSTSHVCEENIPSLGIDELSNGILLCQETRMLIDEKWSVAIMKVWNKQSVHQLSSNAMQNCATGTDLQPCCRLLIPHCPQPIFHLLRLFTCSSRKASVLSARRTLHPSANIFGRQVPHSPQILGMDTQ